MNWLKSFIYKFHRELKWTLLAAAASLVIAIFAVLFTNESSFLSLFSILSTLLSLITTFVVIKLFDEFDSKKVRFARTVNAVDELVKKITSIPFCLNYFTIGSMTDMTNGTTVRLSLNRKATGRIYIDQTSIKILKERSELNHRIYFTGLLLDAIVAPKLSFYDPWLPTEIKEAVKGLLVFNKAEDHSVLGTKDEFIVISDTYMDRFVTDFSYYKISYNSQIHHNQIEIFTLNDLVVYIENLVKIISNWYKENMGVTPDFTGF